MNWMFSLFKPHLCLFLTCSLLLPSFLPSFPLGLQPPALEMKPHTGAAARIAEEEAVGEEDDNAGSGCSQNTSQQPNWMW